MEKTIVVTGVAGFIGFHVARKLLDAGWAVIGIDNLSSYYDVGLKRSRLALLSGFKKFLFFKSDLSDKKSTQEIFRNAPESPVIHLAAQAGVRFSLLRPDLYVEANLSGFLNVLEACRENKSRHLIFASSSSVYGANSKLPFSTSDAVDHPVSLYAATKKSNELMAHSYSHLFEIPCTGLRFFTVYGPWGRPDMAYYSFTKALYDGAPLSVFGRGELLRDFTYVDDICEGIYRLIGTIPKRISGRSPAPNESNIADYKLYNIGNNKPVTVMELVRTLESVTGRKASINFLPVQPGDVPATFADIGDLFEVTGFKPQTSLSDGMQHFVQWFKEFHRIRDAL